MTAIMVNRGGFLPKGTLVGSLLIVGKVIIYMYMPLRIGGWNQKSKPGSREVSMRETKKRENVGNPSSLYTNLIACLQSIIKLDHTLAYTHIRTRTHTHTHTPMHAALVITNGEREN
jgi:hypothetical protein